MAKAINNKNNIELALPLQALTAAAIILPGLFQPPAAHAAEDDSVDFQYSHYQEGKRDIYGSDNSIGNNPNYIKIPQNLNPIEVDSIHASSRFWLTDRIKFAFNYTQDTWSGATPIGTAPAVINANRTLFNSDELSNVTGISGASPLADTPNAGGTPFLFDRQLNTYKPLFNPNSGQFNKPGTINNQLTHVLSYASPETRKQGDFRLDYEWDEAALDVAGGISTENDYESRFASLGGRLDFNQKQTTLNWGLS